MIYELRTYTFRPGQYAVYLPLAERIGYRIRSEGRAVLKGFWHVRGHAQDKVHHLWQYRSFDDRQADREALMLKPEWVQDFLAYALPCMLTQHVAFFAPVGEAPLPESADHAFELKVTTAWPGRLDTVVGVIEATPPSDGRRVLAMLGIAPEPNSIYEVIAHDTRAVDHVAGIGADARLAALAAHVSHTTSELMDPVSFSPLQ